jgi:hypothetical protein
MNKIIISIIAAAIVVSGASFYGGMLYGKSVRPDLSANLNRQRGNAMQQNDGFSGGEIIKKDAQSITVKSNNGSSQIILFSDTTKVMKSVSGVADDLIVGEQVTVTGSKNQDGSMTAQSIQVRPTAPTK